MSDDELTFTPNKDGTISVKDSDGNEVRYAKESDLLAVKGSAEDIKTKAAEVTKSAEEAQKANKAEIETANASLGTSRQDLLKAEVKITTLEEQVKEGAGSTEELAKAKAELETAKTSGAELTAKTLEYRRQIIVSTYGIPADTVKEKSMEELDHYEEALKAVIATKGIGNFATGGGTGGSTPIAPLDRAKATLEAAMDKRKQGFSQNE